MKKGDQIAYVPDQLKHTQRKDWLCTSGIEFGFIYSIIENRAAAFCRYWNPYNINVLRTLANSEITSRRDLFLYVSVPQEQVDATIDIIDKEDA